MTEKSDPVEVLVALMRAPALEAFDRAAKQVELGVEYNCRSQRDVIFAWDAAIRSALAAAEAAGMVMVRREVLDTAYAALSTVEDWQWGKRESDLREDELLSAATVRPMITEALAAIRNTRPAMIEAAALAQQEKP